VSTGDPHTVVMAKMDDGIVRVLSHALEGTQMYPVFCHHLPSGGVKVVYSAILILYKICECASGHGWSVIEGAVNKRSVSI